MTIKIERQTGWLDTLTSYRIYLNSQLVRTIVNNEIQEMQLPQSHCQLRVKKDFQKAAYIDAMEGDHLIIKVNQLGYLLRILYYMGIVSLPMLNLFRYSNPILEQYKYVMLGLIILYILILTVIYITHPTIAIIKKTPNS
ncbi:hypothetical protein [Streptococcus sp. S784/96/1]|uniref:hypothetical protein n=1 Tax=Streptococcus sp. S784/96/1 TaxID=2653499 RepID=UPI001389EB0D|nr:hypothetical protein [Streptococcus sp. S784/96/1]